MPKKKLSKPIVPSETKKLSKKITPEVAREMIISTSSIEGDLRYDLETMADKILPKWLYGSTEKEKKEGFDKFKEKGTAVLLALEKDTHVGLMCSFNKDYRGMAKELAQQIIKEYDCKNHAEVMLVETVVNSYIRYLDNSTRFNNSANAGEYITPNRTNYLAMLSKQMDRAHRQYLSGLITLKQLKAPTIEMTIKANTAFIAQNQQNNANQPQHEIIDPK